MLDKFKFQIRDTVIWLQFPRSSCKYRCVTWNRKGDVEKIAEFILDPVLIAVFSLSFYPIFLKKHVEEFFRARQFNLFLFSLDWILQYANTIFFEKIDTIWCFHNYSLCTFN